MRRYLRRHQLAQRSCWLGFHLQVALTRPRSHSLCIWPAGATATVAGPSTAAASGLVGIGHDVTVVASKLDESIGQGSPPDLVNQSQAGLKPTYHCGT